LEKIGVSEKIVRIIKSIYENMRAMYSLGDTDRMGGMQKGLDKDVC